MFKLQITDYDGVVVYQCSFLLLESMWQSLGSFERTAKLKSDEYTIFVYDSKDSAILQTTFHSDSLNEDYDVFSDLNCLIICCCGELALRANILCDDCLLAHHSCSKCKHRAIDYIKELTEQHERYTQPL